LSVTGRNSGFTLLEVLIAVALVGILTTTLYASYFAVLRAREGSAQAMEERRELVQTLDLIRREVDAARFVKGDRRYRFVVEDRDSFGAPASSLACTTLAPTGGAGGRPESGICDVVYRMVQQEDRDRHQLLRTERDILAPAAAAPLYPQMERIDAFLVECYDGSQWLKSWDTAQNGRLPVQVRVTVRIEEQGKSVEFSIYAAPRAAAS